MPPHRQDIREEPAAIRAQTPIARMPEQIPGVQPSERTAPREIRHERMQGFDTRIEAVCPVHVSKGSEIGVCARIGAQRSPTEPNGAQRSPTEPNGVCGSVMDQSVCTSAVEIIKARFDEVHPDEVKRKLQLQWKQCPPPVGRKARKMLELTVIADVIDNYVRKVNSCCNPLCRAQ